jgi:DNA-binding NtrC family response regulator
LQAEVVAGRFRRDLFYRLAVIHVELPPLRDREDDVLLLGNHFIQTLTNERESPALADDAARALRNYAWPGNVRELRNAIEHALALGQGNTIGVGDLPVTVGRQATDSRQSSLGSRDAALDEAEREYLVALLQDQQGNVAQSARVAGLSRQGLHKLLQKHSLDADTFRK